MLFRSRENYIDHRQKYNYYKSIAYLEPLGYIARTYTKSDSHKDGLQIYSSNDLLADLDIEKNCEIAGADSDYLYLYRLDPEQENIKIYKIEL